MTKLRTLLVDDEPLARSLLRACLEEIPEIEIVGECQNGREAVRSVMQLEPDLMFLDIQMPGMNGFDVIKALQADAMPMVVFSTAYEQYALDAFDVHAVDYLLKPLEEDRLRRAVERAMTRLNAELENDRKPPLIGAIEDVAEKVRRAGITGQDSDPKPEPPAQPKKIAIKDSDTVIMVPEREIDWVDAAGDYMCVHVKGTTHVMRCTMKELLGKLDASTFKRVHRSTIVNLDRIEQVKPYTKGEYFLYLDCGEQLKVSRNYREAIKQFLSDAT